MRLPGGLPRGLRISSLLLVAVVDAGMLSSFARKGYLLKGAFSSSHSTQTDALPFLLLSLQQLSRCPSSCNALATKQALPSSPYLQVTIAVDVAAAAAFHHAWRMQTVSTEAARFAHHSHRLRPSPPQLLRRAFHMPDSTPQNGTGTFPDGQDHPAGQHISAGTCL